MVIWHHNLVREARHLELEVLAKMSWLDLEEQSGGTCVLEVTTAVPIIILGFVPLMLLQQLKSVEALS